MAGRRATNGLAVGIADIEAAATRITGLVEPTPLLRLDRLGLWVKCESFQRTGSFKLRGASNAVRALRPPGAVAGSSGNHGQALAAACALSGIPCTVVMPPEVSPFKRAATLAHGARVVDSPPGALARDRLAGEIAAREGLCLIPAYDHPLVIAGQGTCGLELAEQLPRGATAVLVPLGGGGLLAGIAVALRARLARSVRIVGVEPAAGDDWLRSLGAGERVVVPPPRTICDGARLQTPGELTFPIVQALVDGVVTVGDEEVLDALRDLAACGLVAEPTGALAVAGARRHGIRDAVCVVTGRNVAPVQLASMLAGRPRGGRGR